MTWPDSHRQDLVSTMTSMNINESQWIIVVEMSTSVSSIHRTIKRILDFLLTRHQLENKLRTDKQIEQFI